MHVAVLSAALVPTVCDTLSEVRETHKGVPGWGTFFVSRLVWNM